MNSNDIKMLQKFGEFLSETRMKEGIRVADMCSELHISKRLYNGVWKGSSKDILHYRLIYQYLWKEGDFQLRHRMDKVLLEFFH